MCHRRFLRRARRGAQRVCQYRSRVSNGFGGLWAVGLSREARCASCKPSGPAALSGPARCGALFAQDGQPPSFGAAHVFPLAKCDRPCGHQPGERAHRAEERKTPPAGSSPARYGTPAVGPCFARFEGAPPRAVAHRHARPGDTRIPLRVRCAHLGDVGAARCQRRLRRGPGAPVRQGLEGAHRSLARFGRGLSQTIRARGAPEAARRQGVPVLFRVDARQPDEDRCDAQDVQGDGARGGA